MVLAKRQKNKEVQGVKIIIVNGEIKYNEEIYEFLDEIYISTILPGELQEEAKKLMIS